MGEENDRQKRRRLEEAVGKVEVGRREGRQRCSKDEVEGEKKAMRGRGGVGNRSKSTLICCSLPLVQIRYVNLQPCQFKLVLTGGVKVAVLYFANSPVRPA